MLQFLSVYTNKCVQFNTKKEKGFDLVGDIVCKTTARLTSIPLPFFFTFSFLFFLFLVAFSSLFRTDAVTQNQTNILTYIAYRSIVFSDGCNKSKEIWMKILFEHFKEIKLGNTGSSRSTSISKFGGLRIYVRRHVFKYIRFGGSAVDRVHPHRQRFTSSHSFTLTFAYPFFPFVLHLLMQAMSTL